MWEHEGAWRLPEMNRDEAGALAPTGRAFTFTFTFTFRFTSRPHAAVMARQCTCCSDCAGREQALRPWRAAEAMLRAAAREARYWPSNGTLAALFGAQTASACSRKHAGGARWCLCECLCGHVCGRTVCARLLTRRGLLLTRPHTGYTVLRTL